jgi:hypothetical protein
MNRFRTLVVLVVTFCFLLSCTNYVITTPLTTPLKSTDTCAIGIITDELPSDMDIEAKPTLEEIKMFKDELDYSLNDRGVLQMIDPSSGPAYEVTGGVLEFKRGSGVARFFIGFGVGNAKLTVALRLVDRANSDKVIFAGNFSAQVSDWTTKGDEMYKTAAKNFAKAIQKQLKKLAKESSS